MSQIEYPIRLTHDAQGAMGIVDAKGRAIVWFSDLFKPINGYVWEFPYQERNELVEAIEAFINLRRNVEDSRKPSSP